MKNRKKTWKPGKQLKKEYFRKWEDTNFTINIVLRQYLQAVKNLCTNIQSLLYARLYFEIGVREIF